MATIGIILNDEVITNLDQSGYDYTMDFNAGKIQLTVVCDNRAILNHFHIVSDSNPWVEVKRIRNDIEFVVKENCSISSREARFIFQHNLDSDVIFEFNIVQGGHIYDINTDVHEHTFDTLLDQDDPNVSNLDVNVNAVGGLADFGIKPVREFVRNVGSENFHEVIYDNGLRLLKKSKDRLTIYNYGKVSLYDEVYYEVTLYHCHDTSKTCLIKINYGLDTDSGFDFEDEQD